MSRNIISDYSHGPVIASPPVLASMRLSPLPQQEISKFFAPCTLLIVQASLTESFMKFYAENIE